MARRSEDWNVGLAKDLRDAAFAREFLLASIDEGVDLQLALGRVIRAMGVTEFAAKVHMAAPTSCARSTPPQPNARHAQPSPEAVPASLESGAAYRQSSDCRVIGRTDRAAPNNGRTLWPTYRFQ